jgi:outer membrane protein assembly factor BamB
VIVAGECKGKSFLAGLDRESGKIVWRVARPVAPTFSSPIVARVAGRDQILIAGGDMTAGYDPESGALLWQCEGPTAAVSGTMTVDGDLVYTSGGWPGAQTQCVRVEAAGNSLKGTIVWKNSKNFYVPSLVVHDGLLYAVTTEDGIVWCYDAATGEVLWQKRLGGAFKASPIVAAGRIYCVNEAGKAWVLKAGRKYEALAENDLGDGGYASPVICGGQLFLRTNHHLYCLGERGPGHHR